MLKDRAIRMQISRCQQAPLLQHAHKSRRRPAPDRHDFSPQRHDNKRLKQMRFNIHAFLGSLRLGCDVDSSLLADVQTVQELSNILILYQR